MNEIINNPIFPTCISIIVYLFAKKIFNITKLSVLNPVLVSVLILMLMVTYLNIPYEIYQSNCKPISVLLDASVVALAIPLYKQWEVVKKEWKLISFSLFMGCIVGVISVISIAYVLGASKEVLISLAPKSVTTPIAMSVCQALGGIPPLTAAVVIAVGVFGAAFGLQFLNILGVKRPESVGLAMGAAAHGLGTARLTSLGVSYVAMGGIAIAVNGVLTAIFAPWIVQLFFLIVE